MKLLDREAEFVGAPETWAWLLEAARGLAATRIERERIAQALTRVRTPSRLGVAPFVAAPLSGEHGLVGRVVAAWAPMPAWPVGPAISARVGAWLARVFPDLDAPPIHLHFLGPGFGDRWDGASCSLAAAVAAVSLLADTPVRAELVVSGELAPDGTVAAVGRPTGKRATVFAQWPRAALLCWGDDPALPSLGFDVLDGCLEAGWQESLATRMRTTLPTIRARERAPAVPVRVGPFELLAVIGEGPRGVVWRAEHQDGTPAAVRMHRVGSTTPTIELRAAQRLARADLPLLLPVVDVGRVEPGAARAYAGRLKAGATWVAMPLAAASMDLVPDRGPRLVAELLAALAPLHAAGLVHLRIHPANVFPGTSLRLADPAPAGDGANREALLAPEQREDGPVGPWTDVYTVGLLAGPLLAGHPVDGWLARATAVAHGDRFPDAGVARRALAALLGPDLVPPLPWRPAELADAASPRSELRRDAFVGRDTERETVGFAIGTAVDAGRPLLVRFEGLPGSGRTRLAAWCAARARTLGLPADVSIESGSSLRVTPLTASPAPPDAPAEVCVVRLAPLPGEALLSSAPAHGRAAAARAATLAEGNPGVFRALLRAWPDDVPSGEPWEVLPDELRAALEVWLDGPSPREALWAAAAWGAPMERSDWQALCAQLGCELGATVDDLVDRGVLVTDPRGWRFAHGLARALLEREARRAGEWERAQRACAEAWRGRPGPRALEAVAHHLCRAGDTEEARVAAHLAAEAWLERSQYQAALDVLDTLPGSGVITSRLDATSRLLRARALIGRNEHREASRHADAVRAAAHALGWPDLLVAAYRYLGMVEARHGEPALARSRFERALSLATEHGLVRERARCLLHRSTFLAGRPREARAADLDEALALFAGIDDTHGQADCWLQRFLLEGEAASVGRERLDRALALYTAVDNEFGISRCRNTLGDLARERGDLDAAELNFREAATALERLGTAARAFPDTNLGLLLLARGRPAEARPLLERARRDARETGRRPLVQLCALGLAECAASERDREAAHEAVGLAFASRENRLDVARQAVRSGIALHEAGWSDLAYELATLARDTAASVEDAATLASAADLLTRTES